MDERQPSNVPNFIRAWREHRGLVQQDVGDAIGYSKNHISRWERGERSINVDQLQLVADALQCTIYDLLYCDPNKDIDFFNLWSKLKEDKRDMFRQMVKGLIDE